MQPAVVGAVAGANHVVEALEERQKLLEVVEALELSFLDRPPPALSHAPSMPDPPRGRKLDFFTL